eukprot:395128_1
MAERENLSPEKNVDKSDEIKMLLKEHEQMKKYGVCIIMILVFMLLLVVASFVVNVYNTIEGEGNSISSKNSMGSALFTDNISTILSSKCNITTKTTEYVILLDDSCGLTNDQCTKQLSAIANLVYALKTAPVTPQISIIAMKDSNDNSQRSNIFVELNDPNYQLNIRDYYEEIIVNGPCGNGGRSQFASNPNLLYSINLAAAQLKYQGSPDIADQKIIIVSNCESLVSSIKEESNDKICSEMENMIGLTDVDIHFINAPVFNRNRSSFSVQSPNQYISCMVNNDASKITVVDSFEADSFKTKIEDDLATICRYTFQSTPNVITPTHSPTTESNTQCSVSGYGSNVSMNLTSRVLPQKVLPGSQFFSYSYNMLTGRPPLDLLRDGAYKQILAFSFEKQQVSSGSLDYLVPDQMDLPSISGICHKQSSTSSVSKSSSLSALTRQSSDHSDSMSASVSAGGGGYGVSVSATFGMSLAHSNSQSTSNSRDSAKAGKTESSYTFSKAFLYAAHMRWDIIDQLSSYKQEFIDALSEITRINKITSLNTSEKLDLTEEATYVGNGCCRDELGNYQIWISYNGVNITECWIHCMKLDYCTGIDYRSGGLSVCNIHTENISYHDPYCKAMECYKKTMYEIENYGFLNFGRGKCVVFNDSAVILYKGWVLSLTHCIQICNNQTSPKCVAVQVGYANTEDYIYCYVIRHQIIETFPEYGNERCYVKDSLNMLKKTYAYSYGIRHPSWRNNFWQEAENYCNIHYGSHLATINDDVEYNALGNFCSQVPGETLCIFGLHQFAGRNWKFSSNSKTTSVLVQEFINSHQNAVDNYAVFVGAGTGDYSIVSVTDNDIQPLFFIFMCDKAMDYKSIANSVSKNYYEIDSDVSKAVISFFQNFGTHVVEVGKMGAHCSKTRHFRSGMTSEAYSNNNEKAASSSQSYEAGVSASVAAYGVSGSVSSSFSYSSSESDSSASEESRQQEINVETEEIVADCSGEVFISSECGGMFGTQNQPALVSYSLKPLWEIGAFL